MLIAEGVQFYCPSSAYPAIVLLPSTYFNYGAIFDTSAKRSPKSGKHTEAGCIENYSIVKLYNKVLIITNVLLHDYFKI